MNEDSNLSVASDSQDGTAQVVINTLNGSSNLTPSTTEESSVSNTAATNGTTKPVWYYKPDNVSVSYSKRKTANSTLFEIEKTP